MKITTTLKRLMDQRGLTQKALAEATGLQPSTIKKISENPGRFDAKTLIALCEYFELNDLSELLVLDDNENGSRSNNI